MADPFGRQKGKLKEIRQALQTAIDGYREDPEKIAELLEFKSRFWNYSLRNSILMMSQNPAATFVASYRGWNQKGYHVCKGQHGIKVLYPIRTELIPLGEKDGKKWYRRVANATPEEKKKIASGELKTVTSTRFGAGTVFDISQTDCPPEEYPRFYSMGYSSRQHAELYQAVKQFAESRGIPVKETDLHSISLRGAFYPKENVIRINDKLNDTERLSTLTHELGHALMHNNRAAHDLPEPVMELEADAVSIMLQKHFGIDLTDSRKRHLAGNYRICSELKDFDLNAVLSAVNKTYYNLRKEMKPVFDQAVSNQGLKKGTDAQKKEDGFPQYTHFYYENHYLFTVTGNQEAQKVFDRLTGYVRHLGYSWTDDGKACQSQEKEAPVSGLWDADKTKTACVPCTGGLLKEHMQYLKKVFPPQPRPRPKTQTLPGDYKGQNNAVLDDIKYGVSILALASDMGFTPKQIGNYYTLKEHDSVRIYPETNSYYQFSAGTGGSPIDFVMHLGGYGREEAIKRLKEHYAGNYPGSLPPVTERPKPAEPEKKEFVLPDKVHGKYSRAFAYLVRTRCIDSGIVGQCIRDGLIYEDNRHNVVFVGKDKNGKAAFATRHTSLTGSSFKRDVAGSRQDLGWMVKSPKSQKLYVCEAPVDALSIMTLMKREGKPAEKFCYLATCGTGKSRALYTRLRENPQIQEVVLANDNDDAGKEANRKIYSTLKREFPSVKVKLLKPAGGKDINECLCRKQKKEAAKEQEVER